MRLHDAQLLDGRRSSNRILTEEQIGRRVELTVIRLTEELAVSIVPVRAE
jgi:hypothetical protein